MEYYDTNALASALAGMGALSSLISLAISVIGIVAMWKLFDKAGEPGWGAIIPLYNTYLLFKIAFGNGWLFLLMLVPFVNFVVAIMLPFKMASAYGKGVGFGFGLLFLYPIFVLILAFGDAAYQGA